ncbi:MAG: hypothetical protein ABIO04_13970 [Ferruginibacter sp.]
MKKTFRLVMIAVMAISVTFTSCKKQDAADNAELSTHSDDQARVAESSDDIANDANTAIENFSAFEGRIENTVGILCNAVAVLDSTATDRRITITYNGLNCIGTRTRTGVVVLTMPLGVHWIDANAVLTVTVQNLHVIRIRDNKSITINGVHQIKNVNGGRLGQLSSLGTIVHEITSSGMVVTFDNGTQRTWQVAKRRTFTYAGGIVISTVGMHTDGTTTGVSEWGTNRFGNAFITVITAPMVIRQDCAFRLVSGEVSHQHLAATIVVTFGLDAAGNPASCPGLGGTYYFKLVWTGSNGIVRTIIWPY